MAQKKSFIPSPTIRVEGIMLFGCLSVRPLTFSLRDAVSLYVVKEFQ